jgi:N-acetyl-anhydromuramyl-L-alanine amidase AmpD
MSTHVGRRWSGTRIEDACPCGKAPCGLVDMAQASDDCDQHPTRRAKTIRQVHDSEHCPVHTANHGSASVARVDDGHHAGWASVLIRQGANHWRD